MDDQERGEVKMVGYLEKRGKMKLVSTWKQYWFVLEGQLLLYYRSQLEYLNLSACRGSLNMGLAACVRPGVHRLPGASYIIEVVTRTQVVTLRTKDRATQEQWLQSLLDSMAVSSAIASNRVSGGPLHFRYSMDNLPSIDEAQLAKTQNGTTQGTLNRKPKPSAVARQDSILLRIKKLGGYSLAGSLDNSLNLRTSRRFTEKTIDDSERPDESCLDIHDMTDNNCNLPSHLKTNEELKQHKTKSSNEIDVILEKQTSEKDIPNSKEVFTKADPWSNDNYPDLIHIKPDNMKAQSNRGEDFIRNNQRKSSSVFSDTVEFPSGRDKACCNNSNANESSNYENTEQIAEYDHIHSEQTRENLVENVALYHNNDDSDEESVYYSNYDQIGLMVGMREIETETQPDLPPRPKSFTSPSTSDEEKKTNQTDKELKKKASFQDIAVTAETNKNEQKGKWNRLKKKNKKSSSKEDVSADNTKKRKMSFLKRIMKNYKSKQSEKQLDDINSDDPVYACVDYSSIQRSVDQEEDCSHSSNCHEEQPETLVFGTQSLLPTGAMKELKDKIKARKDSSQDVNSQEPEEEKEEIIFHTPEIHCRDDTKTYIIHEEDNDSLFKEESYPPDLPPRQIKRPKSPWHDVPTNNSPVYGNFTFKSISDSKEKSLNLLSVNYLDPLTGNEEESDNFDDMLGTPQGFAFIRNKWRAVERAREWNRDHRQVAFPGQIKDHSYNMEATKTEMLNCKHLIPEFHIYSEVDKTKKTKNRNEQKNETPYITSLTEDFQLSEIVPNDQTIDARVICYDNSNELSLVNQEHVCQNSPTIPIQTASRNKIDVCLTSTNSELLENNSPSQLKELEGTNRYSDDLNILLAQLVEITTAPLLLPGATSSLVTVSPSQGDHLGCKQEFPLGPIRRRRYSEPDYDIPRPHRPLQRLPPEGSDQPSPTSSTDSDHFKTTGLLSQDVEPSNNTKRQPENLLGAEDESDASWNLSMAPDSLEPVPVNCKTFTEYAQS